MPMEQAELIKRIAPAFESLSNWEKRRFREWEGLDTKGVSLSIKQCQILDTMLSDIDDGKKAVSKEMLDIAKLATDHKHLLFLGEIDFIHKISNMVLGEVKLSKPERAWLRKIEGRIHKAI